VSAKAGRVAPYKTLAFAPAVGALLKAEEMFSLHCLMGLYLYIFACIFQFYIVSDIYSICVYLNTYDVYMQPTRRFVVDVESALLSMLTAHMLAVNSVFITGAKRGKNAVGCNFSFCRVFLQSTSLLKLAQAEE